MTEPELYRRLLQEVDELRHDDPGRAVAVAESARDLVARLEPAPSEDVGWTRLQVEAWSVLGSARRGAGDLAGAEEALAVALAFLAEVPRPEPLLPARLAQRAAYLRRDQGRFDEALRLADEAFDGYVAAGEAERAAGALVDRGLVLGRAGRRADAVGTLARALEHLDPASRDHLAAVHAIALYLHDLAAEDPGLAEEAAGWLGLAVHVHRRRPESLGLVRAETLLARAAIRRGDVESGLALLRASHERCRRLGARHEEAAVLLRIAEAELERGRAGEARRIAGALFPLLRALEHDRSAAAALALFCRAAQVETASPALAGEAARALEGRRGLRLDG